MSFVSLRIHSVVHGYTLNIRAVQRFRASRSDNPCVILFPCNVRVNLFCCLL